MEWYSQYYDFIWSSLEYLTRIDGGIHMWSWYMYIEIEKLSLKTQVKQIRLGGHAWWESYAKIWDALYRKYKKLKTKREQAERQVPLDILIAYVAFKQSAGLWSEELWRWRRRNCYKQKASTLLYGWDTVHKGKSVLALS